MTDELPWSAAARAIFDSGIEIAGERGVAAPSPLDLLHVVLDHEADRRDDVFAVLEVDGDHAVVQECVVVDGVIVRRDSGEIVNDDVATHNTRGELVRVDGVWKVSSARLIQRWEGVAGCALDS